MPPKKPSVNLSNNKSLLTTTTSPSAANYTRQPLPLPVLPQSAPPLWDPTCIPRELFPEWPVASTLSTENWYTAESPYEDPATAELPLPQNIHASSVTWKRPCQFLPPIVDSSPVVPVVPEPKPVASAKKGVANSTKKSEPEPPKKPPQPKYAYIFCADSHDSDHTHGSEYRKLINLGSHASTNHLSALSSLTISQKYHIPRDFRRLWSISEEQELFRWRKEEARIEKEKEQRERVYLGFEDAIAYIINERPRIIEADDVDAEDLIDDEQDEDDDTNVGNDAPGGHDSSPWGILPPPRIEISGNSVFKPETPHGDVVHPDMASYFRIVDQLYSEWMDAAHSECPFLWQAIYPQDSSGNPIYNPGGKYSVKLFVMGKWRRVDVDDKLPVDHEDNIVYLMSSKTNEIWPALLVKALYKVLQWGRRYVSTENIECTGPFDNPCMETVGIVNTVVSALTGWKLSSWDVSTDSAITESSFQLLRKYVPTSQQSDENNDGNMDNELPSDTAVSVDTVTTPASMIDSSGKKARAIICCTASNGAQSLNSREAVLLTDIVGEAGNTTFKFINQNGAASISEDTVAAMQLSFLLLHPPQKCSDLFLQVWSRSHDGVDGVMSENTAPAPFSNPPIQFISIQMPHGTQQTPGDYASESIMPKDAYINAIATLTAVSCSDPSRAEPDTLMESAWKLAHSTGMDPAGSVVLIEEGHRQRCNDDSVGDGGLQAPMILTLNTRKSTLIKVPIVNNRNFTFRVYPQMNLLNGYGLQIESEHTVKFETSSTYWRTLPNFHVVESNGTYQIMLPNSWNILFKQSVEFVPPSDIAELSGPHFVKLHVDMHLSDAMLSRYVHVYIVNDVTNELKSLSTLCSVISLPIEDIKKPFPYTVIVDCTPQHSLVPEGKWHLTLGSNWAFNTSSVHSMKMTSFGGTYEANKPLLCFRDILIAPRTSLWSSFQLQLLHEENVAEHLSAKLEVFDLSNGQLLTETSTTGVARLLQLPSRVRDNSGVAEDKVGYIIQGSIDRLKCVVPDDLRSIRPFRSRLENTTKKEIPPSTIQEGEAVTEMIEEVNCSSISRSLPNLKWQLTCWSTEEVKLEVDRTKENEYDAIRAIWAERAEDRDANGMISRLLFLGKLDTAEARMKQDGLSEEQITKIKSRFEWCETASARMTDGSYLVTTSGERANAKIRTPEDFAEDERILKEEMDAMQLKLAQRRDARLAAKEQRTQELKDLIQSVKDQRAEAMKKWHLLSQERDTLFQKLTVNPRST